MNPRDRRGLDRVFRGSMRPEFVRDDSQENSDAKESGAFYPRLRTAKQPGCGQQAGLLIVYMRASGMTALFSSSIVYSVNRLCLRSPFRPPRHKKLGRSPVDNVRHELICHSTSTQ